MLPTQDKELKARIIQMTVNAENLWEWTPSKTIADVRRDIFIDEVIKEFEKRGYCKSGDGTYRP